MCSVYYTQCTALNVLHSMYCTRCTGLGVPDSKYRTWCIALGVMYSVCCPLCNVLSVLYSLHCTHCCTVLNAMYCTQCTVYCKQCTVLKPVFYYSYCTVKVIYPLSKICLIVFLGETESWIKPYVFYWMDASENVMVKLASGFESAAFLTAGGKDQLYTI